MIDDQYVSQLLVADGTCFGALAFDLETGERTVFLADAVVLAAGGHTRIWRRSSSRRDENTGDGMYLALRAGCRLADMELVQFHPTGMVAPEEAAGTLVTEAVRGEGGQLKNALGERFMARYDPERMELSARDRVALANYTEIAEGRGGPNGGVFLDITHLGQGPPSWRSCRGCTGSSWSCQMLDISQQPMEVAPTAHYSMGGVVVDPETHATDVAGLYAAGEVTAGLHGANRLGGNSLAETVVFGRRAGEAAAAYSASRDLQLRARHVVASRRRGAVQPHPPRPPSSPAPCSGPCATPCGRPAGWSATRPASSTAWSGWPSCGELAGEVDVRPTSEGYADLAHALDLRASLVAAEATLLGALARRESRGAHQRRDFPQLDPELRVNFRTRLEGTSHLTVDRPTGPLRAARAGQLDAIGRGPRLWPGACSSSRGRLRPRRECPCGSPWSTPATCRSYCR